MALGGITMTSNNLMGAVAELLDIKLGEVLK